MIRNFAGFAGLAGLLVCPGLVWLAVTARRECFLAEVDRFMIASIAARRDSPYRLNSMNRQNRNGTSRVLGAVRNSLLFRSGFTRSTMIGSLMRRTCSGSRLAVAAMLAAGLLVAPTPPTFAQDSERNPQADPSDQAGHRPGAAAFPPPNADIGDDPELKAKADKLQAAFRSVTDQLRAAVLKQQAMAIRYANEEANSPADRRAYYLQRQTVRDLLKKTYAAALDL